MNGLTVAKIGSVEHTPAGFEERLEWLCRFGVPRLSRQSDGWYAAIKMNTNTTGSEFKVETDFTCRSPSVAVAQLIERMLEALAAVGAR